MNQSELLQMTRSFQQSATVIALNELDVCSALAEYNEGATAEELAAQLGLHLRSLAALLGASVALGLLQSEAGRYANTALSAECLVKGQPRYIGEQLKGYADQYRAWANLPEAVREGKLILPSLHNEVADDPALRQVLLGLHSGGKSVAPLLLPLLASYLDKAKSLLDIGCGVGTYALTFAQAYQALQVTLFDQPSVLEIAREIVADSPVQTRVHFVPGDYKQDDFGEAEFDIVLFFQVLRTEAPATIQMLVQKAAHALRPGGVVAIYDTWLEDGRAAPAENVFQNLSLSLMYSEGGLFTPGELGQWLNEAGFKPPQFHPIAVARPMVLYLAEREEK